MNKKIYFFFIFFFMAICMLFSVGTFFTEQPKPRANEILTPKPQLLLPDGAINVHYLENVTNYTADHSAFRAELITLQHKILATVFGTSGSKDVILGKEGWLFYEDTKNDYLGKDVLSDSEIQTIAHHIKMMQDYVEEQGAQFLFLIAPNKNSLYGQYMPDLDILSSESNAKKLMAAMQKEEIHFIDFYDIFQKEEEILYHKWDSHWNAKGAALARDVILQTLEISDPLQWYVSPHHIEKNHKGDLYEMLYPSGKELDDNVVFETPFQFVADREIHAPDDIQIDTTNEQKEHSLLMFRDSFGNALYPFLADSFGHSRFSRKMPYPLTMMQEVQADIVIVEIVERNIPNLAKQEFLFEKPCALSKRLLAPSGAKKYIKISKQKGRKQ